MASDSIPEEWRPVEGWPYEVSSLGRVRRAIDSLGASGTYPGRIVSPKPHPTGYFYVVLSKNAKTQTKKVHRLVAEAFHGPAPDAKSHVAHWDGNPTNNAASNLRWATPAENYRDTVRHGRAYRGTAAWTNKLSDEDVKAIRHLAAEGRMLQREIAASYGIDQAHVSQIHLRKRWKWLV
ncbi:MAG: HNH endonuclease [Gemmatimonadetes bacterium]|nr:HNH endonuclease [Gemmatimonadota bacterium]